MTFTLRQLRYAVAVADCGSITDASKSLGISQPAISAAIRELEQEFNLTLFARHPSRKVKLTPSGRRFVAGARDLLGDAQRFENEMAGLGTELSGTLPVGCFRPTAPFMMPLVYRGMREAHPEVGIRIHEADLSDIARLLLEGTIDVALTYDMYLDRNLRFEPLVAVRPYVLLARDDPLAKKSAIRLKDLTQKEMVTLDLPVTQDFFHGLFYAHGLQPNIGFRTTSYEMARSLVGTGAYFAILIMKPVTEQSYDGSPLVCRPIADKVPTPNYGLAYSKSVEPTRLVTAFSEICRQILREEDLARIFYVRHRGDGKRGRAGG